MNEFNNIRRQLDAIDVWHKKLEKGMLRTVFAAAATLTTMSIAVFAGIPFLPFAVVGVAATVAAATLFAKDAGVFKQAVKLGKSLRSFGF